MDEANSINHTRWDCKYHVVFVPKCRRQALYKALRIYLGEIFKRLAQPKESQIEEGHLLPDHVHMLISIPPKYSVSQVIGYINPSLRQGFSIHQHPLHRASDKSRHQSLGGQHR